MDEKSSPVKKPENVTDLEALAKLLAALTVTSTQSDVLCCAGYSRSPPEKLWDTPWAWHNEDCPFRHGHAALLRLLGMAALQPSAPLTGEQAELLEAIARRRAELVR